MSAEDQEVYGKIEKLLVMDTLDRCMHSTDSSELVRLFQIWGACV